MSYRVKLLLFVAATLLFLLAVDTVYEAIQTLRRLDVVEAERDHWQRSADIIASLELQPGDTVVDLGCGSGYFALKLSDAVGPAGTVYAVDIRYLSLTFLWMRTLREHHNVKTVLGISDDPRVPSNVANAVLIANTYHEFVDPPAILKHVSQMLVPDGRVVIVDPLRTEHGTLTAAMVESELRTQGFDIVRREDHLLDQPGDGPWWQVVAKRRD